LSAGIGSLDEQLCLSFSLSAVVKAEVLHALERMLRDNYYMDIKEKLGLMFLRFTNDFYFDTQFPRPSHYFGRKASPAWLLQPGWLSRKFVELNAFLATPGQGLLPSIRRRVESLQRKQACGAASDEEADRAKAGATLIELYDTMRDRLSGIGGMGIGTRELSVRVTMTGMECFELLTPSIAEKIPEQLFA
jgi:hypothetical protein